MRAYLCMLVSVLIHTAAIGLLLSRSPLRAADAPTSAMAWTEAVQKPPPPAIEPPPPEPPAQRATSQRVSKPRTSRVPRTVPNPRATGIPDGKGTLEVGQEGEGTVAKSSEDVAQSSPDAAPPEPAPPPETRRPAHRAELSLWMDPKQLEHIALVRPGTAVLAAVPGFRDVLRGSNIRPFYDLARLRISVTDLTPQQLTVAGVHLSGEQAVRDAAKRIAAMRQREPIWLGDSQLHATSWIDGSGVDRSLALHEGAFPIGAREDLPAVLGSAVAEDRVAELSRLRKRVIFALAIEDAPRYLPALKSCALRALRVSIASTGDGQRMSLRAEYETSSAARQAAACLHALGEGAAPLSRLVAWMSQAQIAPSSYVTQWNAGVQGVEIDDLLDEIAWALRSASRT